MRRRSTLTVLLLPCILVALAVSGCSRSDVRFIPDGGSYTVGEAEEYARSLDLGDAKMRSSEAEEARQAALVHLRRESDAGREAADLLTDQFPPQGGGVPLLVEAATVDGAAAWIVIEASPGENGSLTGRRLWILDRGTGAVVSSAMLR